MGKGKGGGGYSATPSIYETGLATMANKYWGQTNPLRKQYVKQSQDIMSGNYNPTQLPGYEPAYGLARSGLEGQYQNAKNTIMQNTPQGGALTGALNNLAVSRATDVGSLPAQISSNAINNMMNYGYGLATGGAGQAISGMGQAANAYGSQQNAALQANAASRQAQMNQLGNLGMGMGLLGAQSGLFSGIGSGLSGLLGGGSTAATFIPELGAGAGLIPEFNPLTLLAGFL